MVASGVWSLALPVLLANFGAFAAPGVKGWPVAIALSGNAAILGIMIFVNTSVTSALLTQRDGLGKRSGRSSLLVSLGLVASSAIGSAPLSGSYMPSVAAGRTALLGGPVLLLTGLAILNDECRLSGDDFFGRYNRFVVGTR